MAEMNSYYKWSMFFLTVIGLWPYSSNKYRLFHNGTVSLLTSTSVIAQCLAIFTVDRNLFRVLRIVSCTAMTVVAFIRYHLTWYQIDDIKRFLDGIRLDRQVNNKEILRIMQTRAFYGKRLVMIFVAFVYPLWCMMVLYHISPIIMDKILPLNESRPVKFAVDMEFLFDEEQHPLLHTFLVYLLTILDGTVYVGTESLSIMIALHIAGLFDVARFARDLNNFTKISYFVTIIMGVIAISIHLFCLSYTVLQLSDINETLLSVLLFYSTLGYAFLMNLAAEYMINSVGNIALTTYNTNWYETSISTQKLLQMIILKSNRGIDYNILTVYNPSIEGFATLLKTSISYFTVLMSLK